MMVDAWSKIGGSEKVYLFMNKSTKFRRMGDTAVTCMKTSRPSDIPRECTM